MNVCMTATLRAGGTIVLIPRFDATGMLEQIQKHRCTMLPGAPPMYVAWVNHPDLTTYDLSSLRFAGSGAAALPVQVLETFRDRTGVEISEGYGLTEASPGQPQQRRRPRQQARHDRAGRSPAWKRGSLMMKTTMCRPARRAKSSCAARTS